VRLHPHFADVKGTRIPLIRVMLDDATRHLPNPQRRVMRFTRVVFADAGKRDAAEQLRKLRRHWDSFADIGIAVS